MVVAVDNSRARSRSAAASGDREAQDPQLQRHLEIRREYKGQEVMFKAPDGQWAKWRIEEVGGDFAAPTAVLTQLDVAPRHAQQISVPLADAKLATIRWSQEHEGAAIKEAVAKYRRRMTNGEELKLPRRDGGWDTLRFHQVVEGDDDGTIILRNQDGGFVTIRAVELERREAAAAAMRAVEREVVAPTPVLVSETELAAEVEAESEPEVVPTAAAKKKLKLRYGGVDVSEAVEDRARDTAEERLHRDKEEVSGVSGFFAKIFKHNIAYEVFRQWEIAKSRKQILGDRNLYAADNLTREDHTRAVDAVVGRFLQDHEDFLHAEGKDGERRKVFGDTEAERGVKNRLTALVREYAANPDMDTDELQKQRDAIFASANKLAGEDKGRGVMYADNIEKIANEVRRQAAHAGGLENLDLDLEIVIGRAKMGARTEREKNFVDSAMSKLERYGASGNLGAGVVGLFHNEIAVALGTMSAIGAIGTKIGLSSTAAKIASFGGTALMSFGYGWWKEKSRLNRERGIHERQMALGGILRAERDSGEATREEARLEAEFAATPWYQPIRRHDLRQKIKHIHDSVQPRREEMKGFELQRADVSDLLLGARQLLDPSGRELRPDVSFADAADRLAEIEARIRVSDREKVDLLRYSNVAQAEVERRDLDLARMLLKRSLRASNPDFEAEYATILSRRESELYCNESENQKQHRKFADWQQRQSIKRGLTTAAVGVGVGFVGHELWQLGTGGTTTTGSVIDTLRHYLGDAAPTAATGAANVETISSGLFTTPAGTDLVPQPDGSFALTSTADGRVIADGLHVDGTGHLDTGSLDTLRGIGANIVEADRVVSHTSTVTNTERIWDWLRTHAPSVTHIHRDEWMGNDTPMYFSDELQKWLGADHNELKLWWGENNQIGINADGDYVMDMSRMTPDGSWQGGMRVDAPAELVEGKIRLILSASEGSQNHAVEIVVDAQGQAVIPANTDIARTFFREVGGKAVFVGKFAEIAVSKGFDEQGVDHLTVLATHIGKGLKEGITTTEIGESILTPVTQIDLPLDAPPIVIPPVLPITPRKPLERLAKGKRRAVPPPVPPPVVPPGETTGPEIPGGTFAGPGPESPSSKDTEAVPIYPNIPEEERQDLLRDMSPRLRENPEARLNPQEEIEWYFEDMERRYPGYNAEMAILERQNTLPMGKAVEGVVALAVAGHGEGKNIYRTLETYAVQQERTGDSVWQGANSRFEVVLLVNWPKGQDPSETFSEIQRFRSDHPEVTVQVYQEEIEGKVELGWIKRKAFDLACKRYVRRGKKQKKEIFIVANDADTMYSPQTYLTDAVGDMKKHPEYDALLGRQDLDPEVYEKNPSFHAIMRFWQFMESILRSKMGHITTQGRNTVLRGSSYCAVGGNRTRDFWADIEFSKLFSTGRGKQTVGFSNKSWVMVDPRREIDKFKSGELLALTWADFNDRKTVRNGGRAEHAAPENMDMHALAIAAEGDTLVTEFKNRLQDEIQAIVDIFGPKLDGQYPAGGLRTGGSEEYIRRALTILGVQANLTPDGEKLKVELTDTAKLRGLLETYQVEGRKDVKLRKNPLYQKATV